VKGGVSGNNSWLRAASKASKKKRVCNIGFVPLSGCDRCGVEWVRVTGL